MITISVPKGSLVSSLGKEYDNQTLYYNVDYTSYQTSPAPGYFNPVTITNYPAVVVVSSRPVPLNIETPVQYVTLGNIRLGFNTSGSDLSGNALVSGTGSLFLWIRGSFPSQIIPSTMLELDAYLHSLDMLTAINAYMNMNVILNDDFFNATGINEIKRSLTRGYLCDKLKVDVALTLFANTVLAPYVTQIKALPVQNCMSVSYEEISELESDTSELFSDVDQLFYDYYFQQSEIQDILSELIVINNQISEINQQLLQLSEQQSEQQSEFSEVQSEISEINSEISEMQSEIAVLQSEENNQGILIKTLGQTVMTLGTTVNNLLGVVNNILGILGTHSEMSEGVVGALSSTVSDLGTTLGNTLSDVGSTLSSALGDLL
ncbi:MAG: hypothetical protein QXD27_09265 [Metallosphaera sp.]